LEQPIRLESKLFMTTIFSNRLIHLFTVTDVWYILNRTTCYVRLFYTYNCCIDVCVVAFLFTSHSATGKLLIIFRLCRNMLTTDYRKLVLSPLKHKILIFCNMTKKCTINLLTPNVNYSSRTAPLTSKVAFYIFIQQTYVLNILNMVYTLRFFLFKMQFVS